ncbi:hypothetical protein F4802DRAFT_348495 [Xylaria palmicola]|nr:hypothetical protein F4802DRAFT_348495 [Xylaria palmicola]
MAPVQNTFCVIPDAPSALNAHRHGDDHVPHARPSRPPMTTKQVRKAYQKANKAPRLSKAEQRRQELFEQDRIRKEFEKERNQARARTARDRKREKEERDRAEKKKKGLPLVDVRPSQDTIARFVRAKPTSPRDSDTLPLYTKPQKHQAPGPIGQLDDTDKENVRPSGDGYHGVDDRSPTQGHATPPSNKKRRIHSIEEGDEESQTLLRAEDGIASPSPRPHPTGHGTGDHVQGILSPDPNRVGPDIDDNFSAIDFSEDDLLDDLIGEMGAVYGNATALQESIYERQPDQDLRTETPPPKSPEEHVPSLEKAQKPSSLIEVITGPTESLLSPHTALPPGPTSVMNTSRWNSTLEQAKQSLTPRSFTDAPTSCVRNSLPTAPSSRSFHKPRTIMAPPPVPPKFTSSKPVSAGYPRTPQFIKPALPPVRNPNRGYCYSPMARSEKPQENNVPSSTQSFILSHLDDFLPSPSQETREIFEEPQRRDTEGLVKTELASIRVANTTLKSIPPTSEVSTTPNNRGAISTRGLNPDRYDGIQQCECRPKPQESAGQPSIQPISQDTSGMFEMPFFSTQDFLLSSQDVKDIEQPLSTPRAKVPNTKVCVKPQDAPRPPKPLFTSTCRQLRYKYALERTKTAAWEGPSAQQKAREELGQLQALLGKPSEKIQNKENSNDTIGDCTTGADTERKRSPLGEVSSPPTVQVQSCHVSTRRGSGSLAEHTPQNHMRSSANARGSTPKSNDSSRASQQNARPKSSYETMLELLTKAPHKNTHGKADRDGQGEESESGQARKEQPPQQAAVTSFSASQETDYDCGEEWDADDLLCDMF